jgi:hypothetical protein
MQSFLNPVIENWSFCKGVAMRSQKTLRTPEVGYKVDRGAGPERQGRNDAMKNGICWVYFEGKRYHHSLCTSATVIIVSFTESMVALSSRENRICWCCQLPAAIKG